MKFTLTSKSKYHLIAAVLILGLSSQVAAAVKDHRTNWTNQSYYSPSKIPTKIFKHKLKQQDPSYAISPDAVLYKLKQNQKITLVDVRSREDFKRLHIPGSLNIPLHAIKTKGFLKSVAVVLIHEGFQYSLLATECRQLTDKGFKVHILDGGLPAWKRSGNKLAGDLFALDTMQIVSPHELIQEVDYENILLIDVSSSKSNFSRQWMPHSEHLPGSSDPGEWLRRLDRLIKSQKNQPFFTILICNETGDGYHNLNKILTTVGINAFFLQGGVVGYGRYLEDLMLTWQSRDSRIKTSRKCRTCVKEIEKKSIPEFRE
jgi:rhodanese-related sulfurtransferase